MTQEQDTSLVACISDSSQENASLVIEVTRFDYTRHLYVAILATLLNKTRPL